MHWPPPRSEGILPWCLAHIREGDCIIAHHCGSRNDKLRLVARGLRTWESLAGAKNARLRRLRVRPLLLPLIDLRQNASNSLAGKAANTGMVENRRARRR